MRSPILSSVLRSTLVVATALAAPSAAQQTIGGCPLFPVENIWNTPVESLPLLPNSAAIVSQILANGNQTLHPDFGTVWDGAPNGIPYDVVPNAQTLLPIDFDDLGGWPDESDAGPYPIPPNPHIEGGDFDDNFGDRHVLVVRQTACILYELYHSWREGVYEDFTCAIAGASTGWCGLSGAIYDLDSNALRPDSWTSADAAGLPILPGLVRRGEVEGGEIRHALRFTVDITHDTAWTWPARHESGSQVGPNIPQFGMRFRMKASYDISGYTPRIRRIFVALKRYGMILADNGSDWYISGVPDPLWDDDELVEAFHSVPGSAFEVVDTSSLILDPDSGATPHLWSDGFEKGSTVEWDDVVP